MGIKQGFKLKIERTLDGFRSITYLYRKEGASDIFDVRCFSAYGECKFSDFFDNVATELLFELENVLGPKEAKETVEKFLQIRYGPELGGAKVRVI